MISINPTSFGLGAVFGTGVGVFSTRRYLKEKLRAEVMAEAEKEIASMREHFKQKEVALAERRDERTADEVAREMGYVQEGRTVPGDVRVLRPPVPVHDEPQHVHFPEPEAEPQHVFAAGRGSWDWKNEMVTRTKGQPYVIHQTELQEISGFEETSYTYYPVDNVLVDKDGQQIENVEQIIGPVALNSFGHGSEDPDVVFVRNNTLHLHIEIQRLPGRSYAVDVLGLSDDEAG